MATAQSTASNQDLASPQFPPQARTHSAPQGPTSQAQEAIPQAVPPPSGPAHDSPTAALKSGEARVREAHAYLDHRCAKRTVPRAAAPPGHYLALGDGADAPLYPLVEGVTHVGRSLSAELRFEHHQVSRRHAIIARYGNHVRALDDRSSSGTHVNGRRVVAVELVPGDVVALGPLALVYERIR
jgi:hypothetical protein